MNSGNVGIGTENPGAKLDVNGSIKFGSTGTPFMEIKEITGTTSSTQQVVHINYPDRWNQFNTRVLCLEIQWCLDEGCAYYGPGDPNWSMRTSIGLCNIAIIYSESYKNQPYRLVLMKMY